MLFDYFICFIVICVIGYFVIATSDDFDIDKKWAIGFVITMFLLFFYVCFTEYQKYSKLAKHFNMDFDIVYNLNSDNKRKLIDKMNIDITDKINLLIKE